MEIRALDRNDLEQAWDLDREAFNSPLERKEHFLRWEPERLIGAFDDGRLVATSGAFGFGQFFGGRSVPMGGLSSVAVAVDRRGEGLAGRVIVPCLRAMRERGEVISSLYPATTALYRGLGWEVAGSLAWRSLAPRQLEKLPGPSRGRARPATDRDLPALRACYTRFARGANGLLDRPDAWWWFHEQADEQRRFFVAEDEAGDVAGYVAYSPRPGEHSSKGGPFRLALGDFVWTNRDAGLALWRLLGSWSTQVDRILYRGAVEDSAALLLPEQDATMLVDMRWMTRLVDVTGAVEARGFPAGVEVEVPLEIEDAQLPDNAGCWVLHVHGGQGRLERGGPGAVALDVGALSSLYTGWATTAVLARAGRLRGGSDDERAALDTAFAGPTPWLMDEF
ncbi:MAG: GNAT family N-acetyltransferase [Myxococcota bacterium]|nr:GNAT family N-acetyltransferase [Myxococcota bacterium]